MTALALPWAAASILSCWAMGDVQCRGPGLLGNLLGHAGQEFFGGLRISRVGGTGGHSHLWVVRKVQDLAAILIPNPPVDTDRRREDSGRGVRELHAR